MGSANSLQTLCKVQRWLPVKNCISAIFDYKICKKSTLSIHYKSRAYKLSFVQSFCINVLLEELITVHIFLIVGLSSICLSRIKFTFYHERGWQRLKKIDLPLWEIFDLMFKIIEKYKKSLYKICIYNGIKNICLPSGARSLGPEFTYLF